MGFKKMVLWTLKGRRENRDRNRVAISEGSQPGKVFFAAELRWLLRCDDAFLEEAAREFRDCPAAWENLSGLRSATKATDGFAKTVDPAEAFAIWAFVKKERPKVVVELGSQFGVSARLWKEALKKYVPAHELYLCDLVDKRKFVSDADVTFLQGDARVTLKPLLDRCAIDVLINDAHPYDLIDWSLQAGIRAKVRWFAFHDTGRVSSRPPFVRASQKLSREEKLRHSENWTEYGTWERHGMAEAFDMRILDAESCENDKYQLQCFDSFLGYAFVRNKVAL